jgi:hypothetical protein
VELKDYAPISKLLAGIEARLRQKINAGKLDVLEPGKCELSDFESVAAMSYSTRNEVNDLRHRASRVLIRMQYRKLAKRWDRLQTITLIVTCVAFPWLALKDTLYTIIGLSVMLSMLFGVTAFIIFAERKIRRLNREYQALAGS